MKRSSKGRGKASTCYRLKNNPLKNNHKEPKHKTDSPLFHSGQTRRQIIETLSEWERKWLEDNGWEQTKGD